MCGREGTGCDMDRTVTGDVMESVGEKRLMRTRDVAAYLGLSERQVLRMAHGGRIPATKFGCNWFFLPERVVRLVGMDR